MEEQGHMRTVQSKSVCVNKVFIFPSGIDLPGWLVGFRGKTACQEGSVSVEGVGGQSSYSQYSGIGYFPTSLKAHSSSSSSPLAASC